MNKLEVINNILDAPFNTKLCSKCVDVQTHGLVYCKRCGGIYKSYNSLTLLGAIKIASQLPERYYKTMITFRPSHVASVNLRRALKLNSGITKYEFIQHIEKHLKE